METWGFEHRDEMVGQGFALMGYGTIDGGNVKTGGAGGAGKADDLPLPRRVDANFDGKIDGADASPEVGAKKGEIYEARVFIEKIDPTLGKRLITPPNGLWSAAEGKGKIKGVREYAGNYREVDGKAGITCDEERGDFERNAEERSGSAIGKLRESSQINSDWRIVWNEGDSNAPKFVSWGQTLGAAASDVVGDDLYRTELEKAKKRKEGRMNRVREYLEMLMAAIDAGTASLADAMKAMQLIGVLAEDAESKGMAMEIRAVTDADKQLSAMSKDWAAKLKGFKPDGKGAAKRGYKMQADSAEYQEAKRGTESWADTLRMNIRERLTRMQTTRETTQMVHNDYLRLLRTESGSPNG